MNWMKYWQGSDLKRKVMSGVDRRLVRRVSWSRPLKIVTAWLEAGGRG
jgi:hypothetical protein